MWSPDIKKQKSSYILKVNYKTKLRVDLIPFLWAD